MDTEFDYEAWANAKPSAGTAKKEAAMYFSYQQQVFICDTVSTTMNYREATIVFQKKYHTDKTYKQWSA